MPETQQSLGVLISQHRDCKQTSLAFTVFTDCGTNNSNLHFMMNSSGLRVRTDTFYFISFLRSQALNQRLFQLHSDSSVYDSLVFPHSALQRGLVQPGLN